VLSCDLGPPSPSPASEFREGVGHVARERGWGDPNHKTAKKVWYSFYNIHLTALGLCKYLHYLHNTFQSCLGTWAQQQRNKELRLREWIPSVTMRCTDSKNGFLLLQWNVRTDSFCYIGMYRLREWIFFYNEKYRLREWIPSVTIEIYVLRKGIISVTMKCTASENGSLLLQ